jgi:hypothetical protein
MVETWYPAGTLTGTTKLHAVRRILLAASLVGTAASYALNKTVKVLVPCPEKE